MLARGEKDQLCGYMLIDALLIVGALIAAANLPAWLRRRRWLLKAKMGEVGDFKLPWEKR